MAVAQKFQFGTDFREGGRRATDEADLQAARTEAFLAGEMKGRHEAEAQLSAMVAQIARSAERLLSQDAARLVEIETQAARLALTAARRLAGAALDEKPIATLEGAIRECLGHARLAPHLVLRVHEGAVEAAEVLIRRLAQETGFSGRLVVLGEPDMAPGDGRIEWADGGLVVDARRLSDLVEQAVASVFGPAAARGVTN